MPRTPPPSHALIFRWGSFQLRLVGRGPILAWAALIASLLGVRLLWPSLHSVLRQEPVVASKVGVLFPTRYQSAAAACAAASKLTTASS